MTQSRQITDLFLAGVACFGAFHIAQAQPNLPVVNSSGLRMEVDENDSDPALTVVVPGGAENARKTIILLPEHVTVRAHGSSEQQHLYVFRPGKRGTPPRWTRSGDTLSYEAEFGQIHFGAGATLTSDGILFHYDFDNRSLVDYDVVTAVTDPRFHTIFYDPRLERTYVHHSDGFDLLASETPIRLSLPLKDWFPARYHASYTAPVPDDRIQRRSDGITYYYKSQPVDIPMIATLSGDRKWVAASFARNPGNVWSNPELTCQHVDPEISLLHGMKGEYEVKILIFQGTLDEALKKARAQRATLK
jgi:hypothetical protein